MKKWSYTNETADVKLSPFFSSKRIRKAKEYAKQKKRQSKRKRKAKECAKQKKPETVSIILEWNKMDVNNTRLWESSSYCNVEPGTY